MADAEIVDVDAIGAHEVAQAPACSQDDIDEVEMVDDTLHPSLSAAPAQAQPGHSKDDGDDDEEEDEERADETGLRWKKERIAIVFGYIGARFQGLQRNPGAFTVEDELESAIFRAGGITSEPNRQRGARVAARQHAFRRFRQSKMLETFTRLAGTARQEPTRASTPWDRRVTNGAALCSSLRCRCCFLAMQVVSLRMRMPLCDVPQGDPRRFSVDYALMRDRVNAHLGADMRVFDICRVTGAFSSHTHCSGRQYEYVLPTLVLQPPKPVAIISKDPPVPQVLKKAMAATRVWSVASLAVDRFANGEAAAVGSREAAAARSAGSAAAAARSAAAACVIEQALVLLTPSRAASLAPDASLLLSAPDAFQTGVALAAAGAQLAASRATLALTSTPGPHFRISDAVLKRLEAAVACFKGTHAFHNFTPRLTFGDASTSRYISDARVSPPFVVGEGDAALECVRVTFVGQSFLLNQIRHMVGLAVDVARGATPTFMMQVAFGYAVVKLPLAPAEGLYLDRCFYVAYDRQTQALPPPGRGVERKEYPLMTQRSPSGEAATEAFRRDVLLPHMLHSVSEVRPFHAYIRGLLDDPMHYRVHVPRNLAAMIKRGAAAMRNPSSAGQKRDRDEVDPADPEGDGLSALEWMAQRGGAAAAAIVAAGGETSASAAAAALVFAPVNVALLNGGAVSKEAIARSEFKQAQREYKRASGGGWGGGGRPNTWRQDAPGGAESEKGPQSTAGAGGGNTWRGGARSGGWRGGARRGRG